MPPLDEGALLFMPTTLPGISRDRGAAPDAGAGPHSDAVPGSGTACSAKSGRAETSTDPAPFSMMETIDSAQAEIRMAQDRHVVRPVAALDAPDADAHHAGSHFDRSTGRRDGRGAADPGRVQRLDHADQEPHRHADHGRAHAGRHQGLRRRSGRDRADRQGDRSRAAAVCRARAASSPSAWAAAISWISI